MAGAAAPNPDLFDFIESHNNINIDDIISDSSSITSNRDCQTVDVWQDIATAQNN